MLLCSSVEATVTLTARYHRSREFGSKCDRKAGGSGQGLWASFLSVAGLRYHDQSSLGRGGLLWLIGPHHSPSLGEAKARTQGCGAEAMEEDCSLACSACLLPQTRTTCHGVAPHTDGWVLLLSHQSGECPTGFPIGQPDVDIFSVEVPSSP